MTWARFYHCLKFLIYLYFISKQNKVLRTVVKHRTCRKRKWWRRNRPGLKPPAHKCVWNHQGSSKLMESEAGLQAVKEMAKQGTPMQVIEVLEIIR